MKALVLLFGLGLIGFTNAHAQLRLPSKQTSDLSCNVMKPAGKLKDGTPFYLCQSQNVGHAAQYQLAMMQIRIDTAAAISQGSSLKLKLHCSSAEPKGAFMFGGETIGFQGNQKFFYAVSDKTLGRCFLGADRALLDNLYISVKAIIALVPVTQQPVDSKPLFQ